MDIHINRDGAEFGPYSLDDVNAYLADGTLLATDAAWHEGLAEWGTLDEIEGVILPDGHATEEYIEPEPEEVPAPKKGKAVKPVAAAAGGSKKTLVIVLASVFVLLGGAAATVFLVPIGGQTLWVKMAGKGGGKTGAPSPGAGKTAATGSGMPATASGGSINFATQIKPILEKSCYECHNAEKKKGNFRLDDPALALKGGESGLPAIVPGKSAESRLIKLVAREDPDSPMPPKAENALSREQVGLLKQWIDQGAKFQ